MGIRSRHGGRDTAGLVVGMGVSRANGHRNAARVARSGGLWGRLRRLPGQWASDRAMGGAILRVLWSAWAFSGPMGIGTRHGWRDLAVFGSFPALFGPMVVGSRHGWRDL